jgi:hypothetical protein
VPQSSTFTKTTELVRPCCAFPDLLDQENALRKSLAEQIQKLSLLERNQQDHQISFENAGGRTEQIAGKPLTGSKRPDRGYAVAAVKSRWLRHVGREQGELLLIQTGKGFRRPAVQPGR